MIKDKFLVDEKHAGKRVDQFLTEILDIPSRSQLKARIKEIFVNGHISKGGKKLKTGDSIDVIYGAEKKPTIHAEKIDFDILYEDTNVIVLNKPQGIVVHPAAGNYTGTVVNGLIFYLEQENELTDLDAVSRDIRPGIVHRLDKDTSGLLVIAKNIKALEYLASQFKERTVEKEYVAVTRGVPQRDRGTIETYIARDSVHRKRYRCTFGSGKYAVTHYRVLSSYDNYALLLLRPKTGRTHQLRVHMRYIGTPILGDNVYGTRDKNFPNATLMLHAYRLKIRLPDNMGIKIFRAPLPKRIKNILRELYEMYKR